MEEQISEEFVDTEAPQQTNEQSPESPARARIPHKGQFIGIITQRLGGNRMDVRCSDGKTRNCRVPGRYKRALWLRPRDVVLIELWEHDKEKGDVIFKYTPSAVNQLKKRGLLNELTDEF